MNIEALEVKIAKIEVKPGDVVVVMCDQSLHCQQFKTMTEYVQSRVPAGVKVMILDGGLKLATIRERNG